MESTMGTRTVIASPELLRQIFEYCSAVDNRCNALVSRAWSHEALSVLWHKLLSFLPLFKLLSPLKCVLEEGAQYRFERHIQPSDWVTFNKYSWRVRELDVYNHVHEFSESVFIDIVSNLPPSGSTGGLLPNLRRLVYPNEGPSFKFLPWFMTPNLSSFTLRMKLPDNKVQVACSQVMSYLPAKAPKLEHLALMAPEASEAGIQADFRACLEQVITTLPQLKMVEISSSLFTPSTQEALSHLQRVESLSVLACGASGDGERGRGGNPARSLNTFPALTKMTALSSSSFQEITTFIETYRPQSLHELVVASCIKEDDDADWFYVIDQVSSTCPHLRILELRGATGHMTCHAIDDFFSVLRVRLNLTSLILENTPSLLLNAPMLTELVRSLPSLATLTLNEYPSRPPTLPIFCLEAIAPMCSQMKILSLYLDTRLDADIPPLPARFECLEALNIGPSPLRSTALRTTTYLSSVLTDGCRLTRKLDTHISAGQANAKFLSWAPVIEFLPSMMELRKTSANASRIHSNSAS